MPVAFFSPGSSTSNGSNFILNPNAEIDTAYWNLYNNTGRTVPASVLDQDITYTAVAPGDGGNGVVISYIFHPSQSYLTPLVTVVSPLLITVAWYNGPTIANNPTATQLKAAWDAVPGAVAIATSVITGTPTNRQYENGGVTLANGGDASPTDGTGGVVIGVTLVRSTTTPLVGVAEFVLAKDAVSRQGMGVSTDFSINNKDKGAPIQVSVVYRGSAGMVLGTNSDVRVFIYDITNAILIPISPRSTLAAPTGSILSSVGTFTAATNSINYRLIFHISTVSAVAWDLTYDDVVATDVITPGAATEVPSLVLENQPISGAVTDHMCVMWRDSATQWVPATITGATIPVFGTDVTQLGFATDIISGTAEIFIRGAMDGFSFGPFTGYDQYLDNTAGSISPLPSPFTDTYVVVGKAISSTVLSIEFVTHVDLISNGSGTPLKGGLLTNNGVNTGGGDTVLAVGAIGTSLIANSGSANGIAWLPPIVATAPFTFTLATRTLIAATATDSVAGFLSAADHTTYSGYAASIALKANLASPTFTGTPSLPTGTIGVTQTAGNSTTALATTAFVTTADNLKANLVSPTFTGTPTLPTGTIGVTQTAGNNTTAIATTAFVTTADNLKANLASPTFTGTPTLPTGTIGVTQTAGNSTTALATTAFVTTADNLKAPLANPVFTGDVNVSTGNLLISTLGKGPQIKTGVNSKLGSVTLVAGTAAVANTSVTANSLIFLTAQTTGGTVGFYRISAKTVGTSFVITSSNPLDTSVIAWIIVEAIP